MNEAEVDVLKESRRCMACLSRLCFAKNDEQMNDIHSRWAKK